MRTPDGIASAHTQNQHANTGFKEYVDNHVKATTKFQSAEDLLRNAKPLKYLWWNIIPLLGFIISCYITSYRMKKFKKSYPFTADVNLNELNHFLTTNLQYLSPAFGEWGQCADSMVDKAVGKLASKLRDKLKIEEATVHTLQCKFNGEKRSFALVEVKTSSESSTYKIYVLKKTAWYILVLAFFMPGESGQLLTEGGFGKYARTCKVHPILTAAVEYYLKSPSAQAQPAAPDTPDAVQYAQPAAQGTPNAPQYAAPSPVIPKKKKWPIVLGVIGAVLAVIIIVASLSGGGGDSSNLTGPTNPSPSPRVSTTNPVVESIKNGTLNFYPSKILGEALDDFMDDIKWESSEEDGVTYVTVTGGVTYNDEPATALIRYVINDDETFGFDAIEVNGEPYDFYFYYASLVEVYRDELISIVKEGALFSHPEQLLGEAFWYFFEDVEWDVLVADNLEVYVNVSGILLYGGEEALGLVQFRVDTVELEFEYNAFEIDGIGQSDNMFYELMELVLA
jgi:hypothetical protein